MVNHTVYPPSEDGQALIRIHDVLRTHHVRELSAYRPETLYPAGQLCRLHENENNAG